MKKIYVVSYDLWGRDIDEYAGFFEALTQFDGWCHYLLDTWLIATTLTAGQLYDSLSEHLDKHVSILVTEMGSQYAGFMPKHAWEWIEKQSQEVHTENGVPTAKTANVPIAS